MPKMSDRVAENAGAIADELKGNLPALLLKLHELGEHNNPMLAHIEADEALLAYIGYGAVSELFDAIHKYYA